MQYIYFCFLYSIIWLREGRVHTLHDHGNLTIDQGIIMKFYFVFSVGTLNIDKGIYIKTGMLYFVI